MTMFAIVLTVSAIVALLLAGYLYGARAGRGARAALATERNDLQARRVELEARVVELDARVNSQPDVERMLAPLLRKASSDGQAPSIESLRNELHQLNGRNDSFRDEMRAMLAAVAKQGTSPEQLQATLQKVVSTQFAQRGDGAAEMRKVMNEVLAPVLERERVGRAMSSIHAGAGGLRELPTILDAIATKGGFSATVLSDESGLPLAASAGAADVEELAGTAAYFLTLADRAERTSTALPLSCLVLDDANRMTLHRIFRVGDARFTVSAVARGQGLPPTALDGALAPLERVLARPNE